MDCMSIVAYIGPTLSLKMLGELEGKGTSRAEDTARATAFIAHSER